jgi:hypothetical protein
VGATKAEVFENGELRNIFWPKTDELTWDCGRMHNEKFYDLYSSPNIVRVIKSGRIGWAGHVGRMVERKVADRETQGRNHVEDLDVDSRIVLNGFSRTSPGIVDWIYLVHAKFKWRALENMIMNLQVP